MRHGGTDDSGTNATLRRAAARAQPTAELLDEIIRQSPIGVAVIDLDGVYVSVNPAYCAIYGYAESELVGQPFTRVFPAPQQQRIMALHQRFLVDGAELKGEWDVVRRDGAILNILAESVRMPGDDGRPRRLVYVVDITQLKRAEREMRASQQFVQSVLDGLAAHVCVLDPAGLIVAVNRAWRDMALAGGFAPDAHPIGLAYMNVRSPPVPAITDTLSGQVPFHARLNEVLAGRGDGFQCEYACVSPTGPQWFVARVSRMAGSDPARVVIAHDNVTALKQTQAALQEREALLLDLAASIPGAVFRMITQPKGIWSFVYLSPGVQALFEISPALACSDRAALMNCILPQDRPAHDASVMDAIANGRVWEHEYRIRTASGALKWVYAKATPKSGSAGETIWTGLLSDISDRKQIESVLRASEETYRTLFETVPLGIVYQDAQGRITSANPAAQRILGLTLDQLQGRMSIDPRWHAIRVDGSDFPGDQHPAMQALRTGQPVRDVVMGIRIPGRDSAWIQVNAIPIFRSGALVEVYASFEDITERVLLSQELKRQATTDFLTGVASRRAFMDRLDEAFERVRRHAEQSCALLSLDLDHFKRVNDTFGHAAGDAVLRSVTCVMSEVTRRIDLLGRCGGEEFMLLLPDTDCEAAMALAERLRQQVQDTPIAYGNEVIAVTVSIGVSLISADDSTVDAVLARADQALYEAKHGGRNTVRLVLA